MARLQGSKRIWMYQLNPGRGTKFYSENGREIGPTSAENLWKLIQKEGPIQGQWYVTKNFREALPGDSVIVRVNSGLSGSATGVVGFGHLNSVDPDEPSVGIKFDTKITARLMKKPIPLHEVRRVIPTSQSNLGDVTSYRKQIERWMSTGTARVAMAPKRSLQKASKWTEVSDSPPAEPRRPGDYKTSPEEIAQKVEQKNRRHQSLLITLKNMLIANGWRRIGQIVGAVDMRAEKSDTKVMFEAKTIEHKSESRQCRSAHAQLLEYRYFHGNGKEELCIVLDGQPEQRRLGFFDSLSIGVIWVKGKIFHGNRQAKRILGGAIM
jgi:hypothetical protein